MIPLYIIEKFDLGAKEVSVIKKQIERHVKCAKPTGLVKKYENNGAIDEQDYIELEFEVPNVVDEENMYKCIYEKRESEIFGKAKIKEYCFLKTGDIKEFIDFYKNRIDDENKFNLSLEAVKEIFEVKRKSMYFVFFTDRFLYKGKNVIYCVPYNNFSIDNLVIDDDAKGKKTLMYKGEDNFSIEFDGADELQRILIELSRNTGMISAERNDIRNMSDQYWINYYSMLLNILNEGRIYQNFMEACYRLAVIRGHEKKWMEIVNTYRCEAIEDCQEIDDDDLLESCISRVEKWESMNCNKGNRNTQMMMLYVDLCRLFGEIKGNTEQSLFEKKILNKIAVVQEEDEIRTFALGNQRYQRTDINYDILKKINNGITEVLEYFASEFLLLEENRYIAQPEKCAEKMSEVNVKKEKEYKKIFCNFYKWSYEAAIDKSQSMELEYDAYYLKKIEDKRE